jgi:AcrR family transcriptional regulator
MARVVDRDAKRLQLVAAAAACFANSGYDGTSMNDVAVAAGVSKGTLYDYFDGGGVARGNDSGAKLQPHEPAT